MELEGSHLFAHMDSLKFKKQNQGYQNYVTPHRRGTSNQYITSNRNKESYYRPNEEDDDEFFRPENSERGY